VAYVGITGCYDVNDYIHICGNTSSLSITADIHGHRVSRGCFESSVIHISFLTLLEVALSLYSLH
jgi:hypothetical protein